MSSDLRAAECYDAWMAAIAGNWNTESGRDIVWRVRAPKAADAIVQIISNPNLKLEQTDRYFRSLEYHDPAVRTKAMKELLSL